MKNPLLKKIYTPDTVFIRETQILCRLKLLGKHFDLLINFNAPLIKEGIKKIYYNLCVLVSLWLNYYLYKAPILNLLENKNIWAIFMTVS